MSERTRRLRRGIAARTVVHQDRRRVTIDDISIDIDFEKETMVIAAAGVHVATMSMAEVIRRERVLQAPGDGECRASIDRIPGDETAVRLLLEVAAHFTQAEVLGLDMRGTFPELVAQRVAAPVRQAIMNLMAPQPGRIILP